MAQRKKPASLFIVGILQILSGLMHLTAETLFVFTIFVTCALASLSILIGTSTLTGMNLPIWASLILGILLALLTILFLILTIARFILGIREIIGAINLMRGNRKGYFTAKSMSRKDVWSLIFLNFFSMVIGIICWIMLDGRKVRQYFAKSTTRRRTR